VWVERGLSGGANTISLRRNSYILYLAFPSKANTFSESPLGDCLGAGISLDGPLVLL